MMHRFQFGHTGLRHTVSLAVAATSIISVATNMCFVMTKHVFCCDKSMLVLVTKCLSRQKYFCHDKTFVATNICRDIVLSQHAFCCCRHTFFVTSIFLS